MFDLSTEHMDILAEASTNTKRRKIENLIYKTFDLLDKTGANTKNYKRLFSKMTDAQFNIYMKNFIEDEERNFYLQTMTFENESQLSDIKEAAAYLGIPLEEFIYYRNEIGEENNPTRTKAPGAVGYIPVKRLQQLLSKKNNYSIDIDIRNQKIGQVTGDDKVARVGDAENYALTVYKAEAAQREFLGARADNSEEKLQMYQAIGNEGYVKLSDLSSDIESSQTINLIDVQMMAAGIMTDLVSPGLALQRTLKEKETKVRKGSEKEKEK